jgi:hypothetical protein
MGKKWQHQRTCNCDDLASCWWYWMRIRNFFFTIANTCMSTPIAIVMPVCNICPWLQRFGNINDAPRAWTVGEYYISLCEDWEDTRMVS